MLMLNMPRPSGVERAHLVRFLPRRQRDVSSDGCR